MKKLLSTLTILLLFNIAFSASSIVIGVRQTGASSDYEGVIADLEVNVLEGSGHVFIDTTPLTEIDTQASARLASEIACDTLGLDCDDKDFFYVIRGEFPMIGGPSAGAAMTVLTMVELSGVGMNEGVAMTGTVNPDGSVGSIGGLLEKAITADQEGVTTFLIPQGQGVEVANHTFINGMNIIEVSTIREAYGYFTNIFFAEPSDEINFEEFNDFMKPMSEELINYSNDLFATLESQYLISNLTIQDDLIIDLLYNTTVQQRLEMNELYENESYYSAASYSVGASINSLYTFYSMNYFENNNTDYILSLLNFLNNELSNFEYVINQTFILDHINDLEALNIATDRYFEALQLYNEAVDYYTINDTSSVLYNIAFTHVRLKTSEIWLSLLDVFEGDLNIEFSQDLLSECNIIQY
jgi:uncharacterized protein